MCGFKLHFDQVCRIFTGRKSSAALLRRYNCLVYSNQDDYIQKADNVVVIPYGKSMRLVSLGVVQVCAEHDVPVSLEAPVLADIDSWQGVFISSTSRLLLPVREVIYEVDGQLRSRVS